MHIPTRQPILDFSLSIHRATPAPWLRHACLLVPVALCTAAALALALRAMPLTGARG